MKNLFLSTFLIFGVISRAEASGVKLCALTVNSKDGIRAVCVQNPGGTSENAPELLFISSDWSNQKFVANKTTPVNAGINPSYAAEISNYYLLTPKTSVAVFATARKTYQGGVLLSISGSVGGVAPFVASNFKAVNQ